MITEVPAWSVSKPKQQERGPVAWFAMFCGDFIFSPWHCLRRQTGSLLWEGLPGGVTEDFQFIGFTADTVLVAKREVLAGDVNPNFFEDTICEVSLLEGTIVSQKHPQYPAKLARKLVSLPGFGGLRRHLKPLGKTNLGPFPSLEQTPLWEQTEGRLQGGLYWKERQGSCSDPLWFESPAGQHVWEFSATETGFVQDVPGGFEVDYPQHCPSYHVAFPWLYLMKSEPDSRFWVLDMRSGQVTQRISGSPEGMEFIRIVEGDSDGLLALTGTGGNENMTYFARSVEA